MSTQEQASEGVSLDVQRDRIRAYCKAQSLKLIDIKADEGVSGATLDRPALQDALALLRRGRADTLIVMKLDRLSRSLRDVCSLVEEFFSDERYHLLSLCGMVNTHSAAGRMVLMNLANYNQFEREVISERTRDALQHMMKQGVRLGPAPYGYEFSHDTDGNGRRLLVPLADEQEVLHKIRDMRAEGLKLHQIARLLNEKGIPARRDGLWRAQRLSILLRRQGTEQVRSIRPTGPRVPRRHDREAATARAKELRAQGLSLNQIGQRLRKEKPTPLRGGIWHPAQVAKLLQVGLRGDREAALRRALELRAEGTSLREIGIRLAAEGMRPRDGGLWHPAQVRALLVGEESASVGG
ncbi:MAG: recombinase family protein [Myxococcales bacterium]|nr:recombinase family protein [Myxococcales bacterium]